MATFDRSYTTYYWSAILSKALSCIVLEIKRILVENRHFFIPLVFDAPVRGVPVGILSYRWVWKTRMVSLLLPDGKKSLNDMFSCFDSIPTSDRWTDILPRHSPRSTLCIRVAR